jgi:hypothetical protein
MTLYGMLQADRRHIARSAWRLGYSAKEIAAYMDVNENTVTAWLRSLGREERARDMAIDTRYARATGIAIGMGQMNHKYLETLLSGPPLRSVEHARTVLAVIRDDLGKMLVQIDAVMNEANPELVPLPAELITHDEGTSHCTSLPEHKH